MAEERMIIRKAIRGEESVCYGFIEEARAYHKAAGFEQWHPSYPTLQTIEEDVRKGIGFVFAEGDALLGYGCIVIGDEPVYRRIEGAWKTERPYAVVHRMAFGNGSRGKGLAHQAVSLIKEYCRENGTDAIRVDTQGENKVMQHVLEKEGFLFCGHVIFDGGPKLAYEWDR